MSPPNSPIKLDRMTLASQSQRTLELAAGFRLGVLVLFVALGLAWTTSRNVSPSMVVWPLCAYLAVVIPGFAFRRRPAVVRLAGVLPYLDSALALLIHLQGIRVDHARPLDVAAWTVSSVCVYILILVLAGLSSSARSTHPLMGLTPLAVTAEVLLLHLAGTSLATMAVAAGALTFAALATGAASRATAAALNQEEQAKSTRNSLAALQEKHQRLELTQQEKEALLETIVHDMRSPVGAALLSVEYLAIELKKDAKNATLVEATDDALGTLNSLSRMISQILDMSKLESGRLTLRFDLTKVRPVLEESLAEASARANARSISLDLQAPEDLRAALDMRLFPRALDALLTYVIRRTPEHGRVLVVASQGPSEIRASIHSTAPALPDDERRRLFDRFLPTGNEPRRPSTTNVGLYFCRLVAEAHQGSIALEDVDGWSTSIVIRLPLAN
jgi:two-component system, OmpR family, heavy metal sensor histidine kinase CusS